MADGVDLDHTEYVQERAQTLRTEILKWDKSGFDFGQLSLRDRLYVLRFGGQAMAGIDPTTQRTALKDMVSILFTETDMGKLNKRRDLWSDAFDRRSVRHVNDAQACADELAEAIPAFKSFASTSGPMGPSQTIEAWLDTAPWRTNPETGPLLSIIMGSNIDVASYVREEQAELVELSREITKNLAANRRSE